MGRKQKIGHQLGFVLGEGDYKGIVQKHVGTEKVGKKWVYKINGV